jgi:hypothetical protein
MLQRTNVTTQNFINKNQDATTNYKQTKATTKISINKIRMLQQTQTQNLKLLALSIPHGCVYLYVLNTKERKCQVCRNYTYMINFIRLRVSTRNQSSSVHLNLFLWPNSFYKWNASSPHDPIQLYNGYIDRTCCNIKVI